MKRYNLIMIIYETIITLSNTVTLHSYKHNFLFT